MDGYGAGLGYDLSVPQGAPLTTQNIFTKLWMVTSHYIKKKQSFNHNESRDQKYKTL